MSDPINDAEVARPTCKTCPYWDKICLCRRHAPRTIDAFTAYGDFAPVGALDWCGDHPDFPQFLAALRRAQGDAETGGVDG